MNVLKNSLRQQENLRFNCSDLGAITGYHPYSDISLLFEKYLYQDLQILKELDAKDLDIVLLSTDDEIVQVLNKVDNKTKQLFETINQQTEQSTALQFQTQAKDMIKDVDTLLANESIKMKLSKEEIEFLSNEYSGKIKKQYGRFCEDKALQKYEEETGFEVIERNSTMYILEVPHLTKANEFIQIETVDLSQNDEELLLNKNCDNESKVLTTKALTFPLRSLTNEDLNEIQTNLRKRKRKNSKASIAFKLIGLVDGVSYQLDTSSSDVNNWLPTKIIVEIKNRVSRISNPPPLYEQIQLISYLIMLDSSQGDLVQSIPQKQVDTFKIEPPSSTKHETTIGMSVQQPNLALSSIDTGTTTLESQDPSSVPEESGTVSMTYDQTTITTTSKPTKPEKDFLITRIYLDGPPYYHRHHWETVIIPRLHVFRDAILTVRKDDDLRKSFLLSEEEQRLHLIYSLCPYFMNA